MRKCGENKQTNKHVEEEQSRNIRWGKRMSTKSEGCLGATPILKPGASGHKGGGDETLGLCKERSWIKGHWLKVRILEEIHSNEQDKLGEKITFQWKQLSRRFSVFVVDTGKKKRKSFPWDFLITGQTSYGFRVWSAIFSWF